jgi:hypothetical protein
VSAGECPCECTQGPKVLANPPGLSAIAYRVDDFAGFRRALLEPLADEPALLGWRPAKGDLGLQLLEWWAYLADVLTFYCERIANEDYLRTAQLPASVSGLVALLGYQPRPALGAVGQVAAIRTGARPHEPLAIPAGMQIANSATPGVPAQTFEVTTAATFSGHSDTMVRLPPSTVALTPPAGAVAGAQLGSLLLRGSVSGIKPGEELWALSRSWSDSDPATNRWTKLKVLESHSEVAPGGAKNTRVVLEAAEADLLEGLEWLAEAHPAEVRLVRATQSAPLWTQEAEEETFGLSAIEENLWRAALASVVSAIAPGDLVLLDGGEYTGAARVTEAIQSFLSVPYPEPPAKPAVPSIAVAHTDLTFALVWLAGFALGLEEDTRKQVILRYGLRDVGTPIGTPASTLDALPVTVQTALDLALTAGSHEVFLEDASGTGIPVLATTAGTEVNLAAVPSGAGTPPTPAEFSLQAPLRLLLDVLNVARGTSVTGELLGSGDASVAGQTFTLKQQPLTYFAQGTEYASTLEIFVDGIAWSEVPSFYGQAPQATVFVLTQTPTGAGVVHFGDGVNGARLPSGAKVRANYRYGSGHASPPAGRLTTILEPQTNLAKVRNPLAVWGGEDAEQASEVRTSAPASVLTFGRAISADDYQTVAALAPGVSRARAYWTWDAPSQRTLVKVYVGDQTSAVTAAEQALTGAEDPNRPVVVAQASAIELTLTCTLVVAANRVQSEVQAAAEAALVDPETGFFIPSSILIGQPLYSSQIEAALLVEGAEAVRGLAVTRGGVEIFASEPVGAADPGEGAYYTLAAIVITTVTENG